MKKAEINIIVVDHSLEANAIRSVLEGWSIKVNTYYIGQANHFYKLFSATP